MAGQEWFYLRDGERRGPVTEDDLVAVLLKAGDPNSLLVWREDLRSWVAAHSLPEFARRLPPAVPEEQKKWYRRPLMSANAYSNAGIILGLVAMFLYDIGLIPILAVIFSSLGLAKARNYGGTGRAQAGVGLVFGIIYTLMYLRHYGHLK